MKHIYFDQNITKELCNNLDFSKIFPQQQFKSQHKLITTSRTLIELSGLKIKDCLKDNIKYEIDLSDSLSNQVDKAWNYYYENNIKGDVFTILKHGLNKQKQHTTTECGYWIVNSYLEYINSMKGMEDIPFSIAYDRVSALPLEQFKSTNTYLEICNIALDFLVYNPHIPIIKLLIKSYKKLPPSSSEKEREARKMLRKLYETSDFKENGDLIDMELTQFAIMGYGGQSVHFYTKDSSDKIQKRLCLLHLLLKIFKSHFQDQLKEDANLLKSKNLLTKKKVENIASLDFKFGKISIIDDTGHEKECFDVKEMLYSKKIIFKNSTHRNHKCTATP